MIRRLAARVFDAGDRPEPDAETPREILREVDRQELGADDSPDLTARYR